MIAEHPAVSAIYAHLATGKATIQSTGVLYSFLIAIPGAPSMAGEFWGPIHEEIATRLWPEEKVQQARMRKLDKVKSIGWGLYDATAKRRKALHDAEMDRIEAEQLQH